MKNHFKHTKFSSALKKIANEILPGEWDIKYHLQSFTDSKNIADVKFHVYTGSSDTYRPIKNIFLY